MSSTELTPLLLGVLLGLSVAATAEAQENLEFYLGGVVGVSALSPDTTSSTTGNDGGFAFSHYAPESGPVLNLFAGAHASEYITFQANYRWNRNDLTSVAASSAGAVSTFDEQTGRSSQHAVIGDVLLYFRERPSRFRPYLSAGVGAVWVKSEPAAQAGLTSLENSRVSFTEVVAVLRVAVGIDVAVGERWQVRYSFSEGISSNPFSSRLSPPGSRGLMNFQNLVGLVYRF